MRVILVDFDKMTDPNDIVRAIGGVERTIYLFCTLVVVCTLFLAYWLNAIRDEIRRVRQ